MIESEKRILFAKTFFEPHDLTRLVLDEERNVVDSARELFWNPFPFVLCDLFEFSFVHTDAFKYTQEYRMKHLKAKATEQLNLIGIAVTILALVLLTVFIDIKDLKDVIAASGPLAPLLFIVLKASTVVVAPLSGSPLYPLVGLLFGFWPGLLYVVIGDFIGITIAFTLSRLFGYPVVHRFIVGKERGMLAKIVRHVGTTKGFIHMCLTCFALPELIAYGAGLSTLPYWKFILIYLPISIAASSAAVLFGSLLDPSNASFFIAVGVPLAGAAVIGGGALLFFRGVKNKDI